MTESVDQRNIGNVLLAQLCCFLDCLHIDPQDYYTSYWFFVAVAVVIVIIVVADTVTAASPVAAAAAILRCLLKTNETKDTLFKHSFVFVDVVIVVVQFWKSYWNCVCLSWVCCVFILIWLVWEIVIELDCHMFGVIKFKIVDQTKWEREREKKEETK